MRGWRGILGGVLGREQAPVEASAPPARRRINGVDAFEARTFASRMPVDLAFPERDGIAHDSAAAMMESNRGLIMQAQEAFQGKGEMSQADRLILDLIYRFACQVGTLPASRTYHHTSRGGLFQHSLAVAVGALHMAQGKNMVYASSPRDRDAHMLAWQLAVFIAALLHDVGKVHTIGQVQAMSVKIEEDGAFRSISAPTYDTIWHPTVESFERWAENNRVTSYFIDYEKAETRPHSGYTERYVTRIVPPAILAFIHYGNPYVLSMFEAFLRNPDTGANTPLSTLVHDADHMNVVQALDPRRKPGAMEVTGLLWRRLTEFAAEETWNLPTSPFIRAHVYIEGTSPKRFVQMPFFVATQDNISGFIDYIISKPMFGVSLGRYADQVVFGALESAAHLNRTVGDILPAQLRMEDVPDHIPASRAHVLFMPRHPEANFTAGPVSNDPVLLDLPVIALGGTIATHHTQHMPTLGFHTPPSYPVTDSIPIVMIRGEIKPEDPSRENDKSYVDDLDELVGKRTRFRGIARSHNLSPEEAESFGDIAAMRQGAFTFDAADVPRPAEPDAGADHRLSAIMGGRDRAVQESAAVPSETGATSTGDAAPHRKPDAAFAENEADCERADVASTMNGASRDEPHSTSTLIEHPRRKPDGASTASDAAAEGADRTSAPKRAKVNSPARGSAPSRTKGRAQDRTSASKADGQGDAPVQSRGGAFASDAPAEAPMWQALYMARDETASAALWGAVWAFFRNGKGTARSYTAGDGVYAFATQSMSQTMRASFLSALRAADCDPSLVLDGWSAKGLGRDDPGFGAVFSPRKDNHMVVAGEIADLLDRANATAAETEGAAP